MRYLALLLLASAGCGQPQAEAPPAQPPRPEPPDPSAAVAATPAAPAVPWADAMTPAAAGVNRFAFDLYAKLAAEPGNVFVSPFSVSTALAMTADGARGETLAEMRRVLYLPDDPAAAAAGWGGLGRYYSGGDRPYQLTVTNALWGQTSMPWRGEFLASQKTHYGAGLTPLDFRADTEGSRKRINTHIAEATRDKIPELLKGGDIKPNTSLVLTNAIYFLGTWQTPFDKRQTRDGPFRLADGRTMFVPLMWSDHEFRYARADGFELAELPYRGGDLSMVVLLPEKPDGLHAVELRMTADALARALAQAKSRFGTLVLPRFKIDRRYDPEMANALITLGMPSAFGSADFSGMLLGGGLAISKVIHQAVVDVDEKGTEAAAATAVVMGESGSLLQFRADRPFLFLIRDVRHGTILFLGRVANPKGGA